MDYPHHEGNFLGGTLNYLQATVGTADVPESELRKMLGETAIDVFGLDGATLDKLAARIGPSLDTVRKKPVSDLFPRGDVHKPLVPTY
jgi:hypothetical protein